MLRAGFSRHLALIVAVPVLFQFGFLIVLVEASNRAAEQRALQEETTGTMLSTYRVMESLTAARSAVRTYMATTDPQYLASYEAVRRKLPAQLLELRQWEEQEPPYPQKYSLRDLEVAARGVIAFLDGEIKKIAPHSELQDRASHEALARSAAPFIDKAEVFIAEQQSEQTLRHREVLEAEALEHRMALAAFAVNVAATIFLVWLMLRQTRRRLDVIASNMQRFAQGEPLAPLQAEGGEIGLIDSSFHTMAEQLRMAEAALHEKMSALEEARAALQQTNQELAHMNSEKNHFLGMAAHDLRNPLFSVLTFSEVLLRRGGASEKDQEIIRRIQESVRAMTRLVNDFLDVAQVEAGELRLQKREMDLDALSRETIAAHSPLAEQKSQHVSVASGAPLPVVADRDKLGQVISNLFTNAVKYSPNGSRIEVHVERYDHHVRFSVRDQGAGIAPEEMERLFKPFSRTSSQTTGGERSTGLGLAICRKIIEGHSGTIAATSEQGKGSTFYFELPAKGD